MNMMFTCHCHTGELRARPGQARPGSLECKLQCQLGQVKPLPGTVVCSSLASFFDFWRGWVPVRGSLSCEQAHRQRTGIDDADLHSTARPTLRRQHTNNMRPVPDPQLTVLSKLNARKLLELSCLSRSMMILCQTQLRMHHAHTSLLPDNTPAAGVTCYQPYFPYPPTTPVSPQSRRCSFLTRCHSSSNDNKTELCQRFLHITEAAFQAIHHCHHTATVDSNTISFLQTTPLQGMSHNKVAQLQQPAS